jgi:hypothetical protein
MAHRNLLQPSRINIALPGQGFLDDIGFYLPLIVKTKVAKISTPDSLVWFSGDICLWPHVVNSMRAR